MRDEDEDILSLIAGGESSRLEFKTSARWDLHFNQKNKDLEEEIVRGVNAFINTDGGVLLIGVTDDGQIVGLDKDYATLRQRKNKDGYESFLYDLLLGRLGKDTSRFIQITFPKENGIELCKVELSRSLSPIFVKESNGREENAYIRTGNSKRLLTTKEAINYFWERLGLQNEPKLFRENDALITLKFLGHFIEFEKTLESTLRAMGVFGWEGKNTFVPERGWKMFVEQAGETAKEMHSVVGDAIKLRSYLHKGVSDNTLSEKINSLLPHLNEVSKFIRTYGFSIDILPFLRSRYGSWLRPEISAVRLVQKNKKVFLETVVIKQVGVGANELLSRIDLSFIGGKSSEKEFSPEQTAEKNADKFLRMMDPYSLIMCTDLFTSAACEEIDKEHMHLKP